MARGDWRLVIPGDTDSAWVVVAWRASWPEAPRLILRPGARRTRERPSRNPYDKKGSRGAALPRPLPASGHQLRVEERLSAAAHAMEALDPLAERRLFAQRLRTFDEARGVGYQPLRVQHAR